MKETKGQLRQQVARLTLENASLKRQRDEADKLLDELLKASLLQQYHTARELGGRNIVPSPLEWRMHPKWQSLLFRIFDLNFGQGFSAYMPRPEAGEDTLFGFPVKADALYKAPELARRRG